MTFLKKYKFLATATVLERPFHYEGLYGMVGPGMSSNNNNNYKIQQQQNDELPNGGGFRKRSFQQHNEKSELFAEWQNERYFLTFNYCKFIANFYMSLNIKNF